MSRELFFTTLDVMKGLVDDPRLAASLSVSTVASVRASIIRRGIAISAFALFESHIENLVTASALGLQQSGVPYQDFSDRLREFFSVDAIQGLLTRVKFQDRADQLSFAEMHISRLGKIMDLPPSYTHFGFSPKGSNVGAEDIPTLLTAFGLDRGWDRLTMLSRALGASHLSLKSDFLNCLRNRNKCAHDASYDIPSSDLKSHIAAITMVGITLDITLKHIVNSYASAVSLAGAVAGCKNLPTTFRFVDELAVARWAERISGGSRPVKYYSTEALARAGAISRRRDLPIIFRDRQQIPVRLLFKSP